jgi:GTPase SAR1 family protein
MKNVFIKYNPYKLETEITVDGKKLAQNSKLGEKSADGSRLQEWVEELPQILINEYNDTDFVIKFHGTLLDYEDLTSVLAEAQNRGKITVRYERKPAKETSDKEALIDDVFHEIQKGPYDELRYEQINSAFQHAKSSDFELCVVATMSAGKSTLINSMLGQKLMPSKQEACTAMITRIKDVQSNSKNFKVKIYDNNNMKLHEEDFATLELLNLYNACPIKYGCVHRTAECPKAPMKPDECSYMDNSRPRVGTVCLYGKIPFVESDDVSLVLIDTPGPNNSRDKNHARVQSELLGKSSKALVLYIMTGEFGTDDDNILLKRVAESMAVGGKQSKDRFIFVVNKLDDRKKEDGDTSQTLERVRSYLKTHGIANPNLFPAAALPALNLRMMMSGAEIDEDTVDETEIKVKKLNRNETLHFETYATLPASLRGEINGQLDAVRSSYGGRDNENPHEALIHTGVISIEAAIRQYVQKYAKTAKVKNIVDTFMSKLDELDCVEATKRELAKNIDKSAKIVQQIESIRKKMDDAKDAKKFKDAVDDAVVKVNDDSREVVEGIIEKFQSRITKRIDALRGQELELDDAEDEVERLEKFAKNLEPDFEVELDEL